MERTPLEQELNQLWEKPSIIRVVYKDLPRLASRITVEGNFSKPPRFSRFSQKITSNIFVESQSGIHKINKKLFIIIMIEKIKQLENFYILMHNLSDKIPKM